MVETTDNRQYPSPPPLPPPPCPRPRPRPPPNPNSFLDRINKDQNDTRNSRSPSAESQFPANYAANTKPHPAPITENKSNMAITTPPSSNFAGHVNMPIFEGEDYEYWSIQMRGLFISEGLWDLVQNGYDLPANAAELESWNEKKKKERFDENRSKDARALLYIRQGVSKNIFLKIKEASTSQIAWEKLKNEFEGSEQRVWLRRIQHDFEQLTSVSSSWNICRIPSKLRNYKNDAYTPQIISIGPLHHGMENVVGMEECKSQYMLTLLQNQKTDSPVEILDECSKAILLLDGRVRACYAEPIKYSQYDLARMLLLDGCFILELFLGISNPVNPISTTSWMISALRRDLSLLENQIPFFVLEELYKTIVRPEPGTTLLELALRFFKPDLAKDEGKLSGGHHLLDILHKYSYLSSSRRTDPGGQGALNLMRCAANLSEAGIQFTRKDPPTNLFDLEFANGVFKIPRLVVNDSTDSLFRNLIAFERLFPSNGQHVTSYLLLMDRLVDTTEDVKILERKQIIANDLGGFEDVTNLFNNICKEVPVNEFHFAELCEQVDTYYNKRRHRHMATFRRSYLSNPWTIISILAAAVLLALTILQGIYSVLSYYPH